MDQLERQAAVLLRRATAPPLGIVRRRAAEMRRRRRSIGAAVVVVGLLGAGGALVSQLSETPSREIRSVGSGETSTTREPFSTTAAVPASTTSTSAGPPSTPSTSLPPTGPFAQAVLGFDRLGPIVIGMSRAEAEIASATTFLENKINEGDDCAIWTPSGAPNVWIRALDGRVKAIEVGAPASTAAGLTTGASESEVRSIYGSQVETRLNRFAIREDVVTPSDPALSSLRLVILYETDGVTVDRFRVGTTDDVLVADEGCA
jgi:hypothetical protein